MAAAYGLLRVAAKPDSYEICFVPDNDYRRFLRDRVGDLDARVGKGPFVTSSGTVVGQHEGFPYYTIGQRHGLGIAMGEPYYVTAIDAQSNTVTVGPREELVKHSLIADQFNGVKAASIGDDRPVDAKIRYNDAGAAAIATQLTEDRIRVDFAEGRSAITPGQAVVLYEGDDVLGGAWIREVPEDASMNEFIALPLSGSTSFGSAE